MSISRYREERGKWELVAQIIIESDNADSCYKLEALKIVFAQLRGVEACIEAEEMKNGGAKDESV